MLVMLLIYNSKEVLLGEVQLIRKKVSQREKETGAEGFSLPEPAWDFSPI